MKYNKRGPDGKFKKSIIERPITRWENGYLTDNDDKFTNWMDEITQAVNELREERQQKPCTCGHSKEDGSKVDWEEMVEEIVSVYCIYYHGLGSKSVRQAVIDIFKMHGLIK